MRFCKLVFAGQKGIGIRALSLGIVFLTFVLTISMGVQPAGALTNDTLVVRDDAGGSVVKRAALIQTYKENGTRVELRGNYCMSACTMYLGLKNTCVAPNTIFGFHGPSSRSYGISLSAVAFERWSTVMADHYPEPLRTWYLKNGRNRTVGFYRFSGSDLIKLGIARC